MRNRNVNRRQFLANTTRLAGAGWLATNAPLLLAAGHAAAEQHEEGAAWSNMTPAEAAALAALADQVIPPDDLPGAAEIGVVRFIDNVLGGFLADSGPILKQGVRDLDRRAAEVFAGSDGFSSLSFEQQTDIVRQVEESEFFEEMIFLTHCGMFAMPSWGGNRNKAGWALLGFEDIHAWQPPFGHYDALATAKGGDDHVDG